MSRLSFPHDIVISLFCVPALILNVLNVVCSAAGQRVNAVDVIQIVKSALSLAALTICVPMAAAGLDGNVDSVIVFDAVTDIMDILLIHVLPLASLVMAVARLKISTCTFVARDVIRRKWSLIALILSIIPIATMVILRVLIAIHDVKSVHSQGHQNTTLESLQPVHDRKWFDIFQIVRICGLNISPTIAGIVVYAMIHHHLAAQDIRKRSNSSRFTSMASSSSRKTTTSSSEPTHSQASRQVSTTTSVFSSSVERIRSPSETIRLTVVVLIISHLSSWTTYLVLDSLLLFDVKLPEGCVMYGKVLVLLCNPIGDGVFQKTKRDRLAATIRKVLNRNKVNAEDETYEIPPHHFSQNRKSESAPYSPELSVLAEEKLEESSTSDSVFVLFPSNDCSPALPDKSAFDQQHDGKNTDRKRRSPSAIFLPVTESTENNELHSVAILPSIEKKMDATSRSYKVEPIFKPCDSIRKAPDDFVSAYSKFKEDKKFKSAMTANDSLLACTAMVAEDNEKIRKYSVSKGALVEMYLNGESNLSHHLQRADRQSQTTDSTRTPPILLISRAPSCSSLKRINSVGSLNSVCSEFPRKGSTTSAATNHKRGSYASGLSSEKALRLASITSAEGNLMSFLQRQNSTSSSSVATHADIRSRPPSRCDNVSENRRFSRNDSVFTIEDVTDWTTCALTVISEYF